MLGQPVTSNQKPEASFEQANTYYQNKDYIKAIELYDSILAQGVESAALYYNLANAHFKINNIPAAILNYERAKKLIPSDEDILFNLKIANLRIVDKIEPLPSMFYNRWWEELVRLNSSAGWSNVLLSLLWTALVSGFLFLTAPAIRIKRIIFVVGIVALIIAGLFLVFARQQYQYEQNSNFAIVFAPNVYIKSAPDEQSTDLFILHEGIKVEIIDKVGEWEKLRLADGKVGWIKGEAAEGI